MSLKVIVIKSYELHNVTTSTFEALFRMSHWTSYKEVYVSMPLDEKELKTVEEFLVSKRIDFGRGDVQSHMLH